MFKHETSVILLQTSAYFSHPLKKNKWLSILKPKTFAIQIV